MCVGECMVLCMGECVCLRRKVSHSAICVSQTEPPIKVLLHYFRFVSFPLSFLSWPVLQKVLHSNFLGHGMD